jgi:hypothetical protein
MAKTQTELESPAKVYQLIAIETKVDSLFEVVKKIEANTTGVATVGYVAGAIEKVEDELRKYIDKEISDTVVNIHAKYEPMQKEHEWVKYTVIGGIALQLIVAGILYLVTKGV